VRRESPHELTAAARIVDVQEKVRAKVRLRTMAQNCSLNVVEVDGGAVTWFFASLYFE
jgi:hypothetical protein